MSQKGNVTDIYSLTPLQEGMLFHWLVDKTSTAYFEQLEIELGGNIDVNRIEESINQIIQRYDVLRTVFIYERVKNPLQVVLRERKLNVHFEDISNLGDEKDDYIAAFKEKDKAEGFDLTRDLLMRMTVLKKEENRFVLVWSLHHILMDGWCTAIIFQELMAVYMAMENGTNLQLPPVVPYKTYISWLERQDKEKGIAHWKNYLAGYEGKAQLPRFAEQTEPQKGYRLEEVVVEWGNETEGLTRLARTNQATVNTLMQVMWGILLQRYNNSEDVVYGAVVSGRPAEIDEIETMVGLMINTVPVRISTEQADSFNGLLRKVQKDSLTSKLYEYLPLSEIQDNSSMKRDLIDHIMIFENYPVQHEVKGAGNQQNAGFEVRDVKNFEQTHYDFNFIVVPGTPMVLKFSYNTLHYTRAQVRQIEAHLKQLALRVLENPGIAVGHIDILPENEKRRICEELNDTAVKYPGEKTIHELFEEQAVRQPEAMALNCGDKQLTYGALAQWVNRQAGYLTEKGVGPGTIAGIMVERSLEMVIALLGILKTGAAYLPIDIEYPEDRIAYMLEDSNAALLLTTPTAISRFKAGKFSGEIIHQTRWMIECLGEARNDAEIMKNSPAVPDSLAYVIYTSGSSGKPKGVMLEHRQMVNFFTGIADRIPFLPGKTILALTTISFDIFALEILLPLTRGLNVVVADEMHQVDPVQLALEIQKKRVRMMQVTPSRLKMLLGSGGDTVSLEHVEELMVGGEAFPDDLLQLLRNGGYRGKIFNMYGPTETTVWSAVRELTEVETVDIGSPIANTRIYIVDKRDRIQPVGVAGELWIGGDGVGRGYVNNSDATTEKFIDDPFHTHGRIYKTGDLARWLPNGNIQFYGRMDTQVKIRGYRIELEEIETHLRNRSGIEAAVVIDRESAEGVEKYLCAYYVSETEHTISELREYLAIRVPQYMLPTYFMRLDEIPLTPNGKVNRKALPEIEGDRPMLKTEYVEPTTEIEKNIADAWKEILMLEDVGVNDNFFELGGNSLRLIRLHSRLKEKLNKDMPIMKLLEYTTIRTQAELMALGETAETADDIEKRRGQKIEQGKDRRLQRMQRVRGKRGV